MRKTSLLICVLLAFIFPSLSLAEKHLDIVVVEDAELKITGKYLGELQFKEKGFTTHCSYLEVIRSLKEHALDSGANLMQIIKHKKPDAWSSCHRMTVSIYKVDDIRQYREKVFWSKNAKLTWNDFTVQEDNDQLMSAESYSELTYETSPISLFKKIKYHVSTSFIPAKSWVKQDDTTAELLNHEQRHFDLWEVYARIFYKQLTESKEFSFSIRNVNILFRAIYNDCTEKQNTYDKETDHGRDPIAQQHWDYIIDSKLAELSYYSDHY